jgi:ubiquinone/menaquinone biosynthesis C-methylase UbiE
LSTWIEWAGVSASSHLLDLACSTGFSSREAYKRVSCTAKGIDLSFSSIKMAEEEAKKIQAESSLSYCVGDAADLPFTDEEFTHVLGGCNFAFIQERTKALAEVHRVLQDGGKLCVANFHYTATPSVDLLNQVEQAIGFRPYAEWTYEWWNSFFDPLFVPLHSEIFDLPVMSDEQLKNDVRHVIEISPQLKNYSEEIKTFCIEKLTFIRLILNRHRMAVHFSSVFLLRSI